MNLLELPRPDDPELEVLYEREMYEHHLSAARAAVESYPETVARVLADVWMQSTMLDVLRGSIR